MVSFEQASALFSGDSDSETNPKQSPRCESKQALRSLFSKGAGVVQLQDLDEKLVEQLCVVAHLVEAETQSSFVPNHCLRPAQSMFQPVISKPCTSLGCCMGRLGAKSRR